MNKVNKKITVFIIFLIFLVIIGLFVKMTIFTPTLTNEPHEGNVAGVIIQFRDGITEQECKKYS